MEEVSKKKSNKGLIAIIIILVILLLGSIGYICYDKGIFDGLTTKEKSVEEPKKVNVKTEKKVTVLKVQELIETVPYSDFEGTDAYSGSLITINDIDHSLLLSRALHSLRNIDKFDGSPELLKNEVKALYNIDNVKHQDFLNFKYDSTKNRYTQIMGYGGPVATYDFMSKLIDYEEEDGLLNVYQRVGFIVSADAIEPSPEAAYSLATVKSSFNNKISKDKVVKEIGSLDDLEDNARSKAKSIFDENLDKFNTYKHTFKKASDGKYYWYSSEIVNE